MKALLPFAVIAAAAFQAPAAPVFSCQIGQDHLRVEAEGDALRLIFGDPAAGGGEVASSAETPVRHGYVIYNRAEDRWLRFTDGGESLMVFERWAAPAAFGEPERLTSGLLVFAGEDLIAALGCEDPAAFAPDHDYEALASDDPAFARFLPDPYGPAPEDADEALNVFGLLLSAEDAPYPMFVLDVEFPEKGTREAFMLNMADGAIDPAALDGMVGGYVTIWYDSLLEPSAHDIAIDGRSIFGGGLVTPAEGDSVVTGALSGAAEVSAGDLPDEFVISPPDGAPVRFPYFIPAELVAVNGRTVTVHYSLRTVNDVLAIEAASD